MEARPVDPRDISVEIEPLSYRVVLWLTETLSTEYDITGAHDVVEVIDWCVARDEAVSFSIFAVFRIGSGELGAIQLSGSGQ